MTIDAFLDCIHDKKPLMDDREIELFERRIGGPLPADYRSFLRRCNGGFAGGGVWYYEKDVGVHHVGGFREESHFSLPRHWEVLRPFLPPDLIPFSDDPFGNAICIGFSGASEGRVYFWDHEEAYDPPMLIADSFSEFVDRLEEEREEMG